MFNRPAAGRAWFERTLPDQLTFGRPDQAAVVFGRRVSRQTPGRFHRRSSTKGSSPRSRCTTAPRRSSSTSKRAARSGPRPPSTTPATSGSADDSPRPTGRAHQHRPPGQPALPRSSTCGVRVRARRHDASARGAAIDRRWPTSPGLRFGSRARWRYSPACAAISTCRGPDEPLPARADRRAHPRLRRPPDHLRPAATTPQRFDPAHPAPTSTRSPARDAAWPSSHQDLRGSSTVLAELDPALPTTSPTARHSPKAGERTNAPLTTESRRHVSSGHDSFVNPSTA